MRNIHNTAYDRIYYLGVWANLWPGPQYYGLAEHGVRATVMSPLARTIIQTLTENGYQALIVGGCVRDYLCKIAPKDFDVVTNATPKQVRKLFRRSRIIGKRFQIVHVVSKDEVIEVSTFRAMESWWDKCIAKLMNKPNHVNNLYGTLVQDKQRRDFSANALYYDIATEQIIDFTGGYRAIQQKQLEVIGETKLRFQQDPVRAIRALRFAAKTNFALSDSICANLAVGLQRLPSLSADRLLVEMTKLFYQGYGQASLAMLDNYNVLAVLFPGYAGLTKQEKQVAVTFLQALMCHADRRYQQNKHLSVGFLLAGLLWPVLQKQARKEGIKVALAVWIQHIKKVLRQEKKVVAITKRLQEVVQDIWVLQYRFAHDRLKKHLVVKHPRFHAGYDFLAIRSQVEQDAVSAAIYWHEVDAQRRAKPQKDKQGDRA